MFQIPAAVLKPESKAQFQRAAEALLRAIAQDLGHQVVEYFVESTSTCASTMGTVSINTSSLSLEVYMDSFGVRPAARLVYRDRFGIAPAFKYLSDLEMPGARAALLAELKIIARNAKPAPYAKAARGSLVRRFGALFA